MNINEILAGVDNTGRVALRQLRDLISDPSGAVSRIGSRAGEDIRSVNDRIKLLDDQRQLREAGSVMADAPQYSRALSDVTNAVTGAAPVGMMVGRTSKSWGQNMARKALEMDRQGADPRTIWQETGNWKGPDGHWRQELSDRAATWQGEMPYTKTSPDKLIDHQSLFDAYPQLKDINAMYLPSKKGASFNPADYSIQIGGTAKDARMMSNSGKTSMTLHELQHAIQDIEKWAKGGSPEGMQKLAQWHEEIKARNPASRVETDPNALYRALAGETEARAVQTRKNMDFRTRRATFPEDSYDVPLSDLIIQR